MANKILVIDDEPLVTKSVSRLLSKQGYDVTTCSDGKSAIEESKHNSFDLIVCDIRMPEINGVETLKIIRTDLQARNEPLIPEILITGYAEAAANSEAEALQVAEYISKPFDLRHFLSCVEKHLKK